MASSRSSSTAPRSQSQGPTSAKPTPVIKPAPDASRSSMLAALQKNQGRDAKKRAEREAVQQARMLDAANSTQSAPTVSGHGPSATSTARRSASLTMRAGDDAAPWAIKIQQRKIKGQQRMDEQKRKDCAAIELEQVRMSILNSNKTQHHLTKEAPESLDTAKARVIAQYHSKHQIVSSAPRREGFFGKMRRALGKKSLAPLPQYIAESGKKAPEKKPDADDSKSSTKSGKSSKKRDHSNKRAQKSTSAQSSGRDESEQKTTYEEMSARSEHEEAQQQEQVQEVQDETPNPYSRALMNNVLAAEVLQSDSAKAIEHEPPMILDPWAPLEVLLAQNKYFDADHVARNTALNFASGLMPVTPTNALDDDNPTHLGTAMADDDPRTAKATKHVAFNHEVRARTFLVGTETLGKETKEVLVTNKPPPSPTPSQIEQ